MGIHRQDPAVLHRPNPSVKLTSNGGERLACYFSIGASRLRPLT